MDTLKCLLDRSGLTDEQKAEIEKYYPGDSREAQSIAVALQLYALKNGVDSSINSWLEQLNIKLFQFPNLIESAGADASKAMAVQGITGGVVINTADQIGVNGGQCISNTASHTLDFTAIQIISDATFTSITGNITGLTGIVIPAGTVIRGTFTAVQLTSGTIIAYA